MKTFIQNGDVITVTTPAGGVASGDAVIVGNLFGIAAFTVSAVSSAPFARGGKPRCSEPLGASTHDDFRVYAQV